MKPEDKIFLMGDKFGLKGRTIKDALESDFYTVENIYQNLEKLSKTNKELFNSPIDKENENSPTYADFYNDLSQSIDKYRPDEPEESQLPIEKELPPEAFIMPPNFMRNRKYGPAFVVPRNNVGGDFRNLGPWHLNKILLVANSTEREKYKETLDNIRRYVEEAGFLDPQLNAKFKNSWIVPNINSISFSKYKDIIGKQIKKLDTNQLLFLYRTLKNELNKVNDEEFLKNIEKILNNTISLLVNNGDLIQVNDEFLTKKEYVGYLKFKDSEFVGDVGDVRDFALLIIERPPAKGRTMKMKDDSRGKLLYYKYVFKELGTENIIEYIYIAQSREKNKDLLDFHYELDNSNGVLSDIFYVTAKVGKHNTYKGIKTTRIVEPVLDSVKKNEYSKKISNLEKKEKMRMSNIDKKYQEFLKKEKAKNESIVHDKEIINEHLQKIINKTYYNKDRF